MKKIEKIAREIFQLDGDQPSRSGGGHVISINSVVDRSDFPDQIAAKDCELNGLIDHTILKPDATVDDIIKICKEVKLYRFASVCLNPCWVSLAAAHLKDGVVCTVIGFPLGANSSVMKAFEARLAIENGAKEIDMVINIGQLKSGNFDLVYQDIAIVSDTCQQNNTLLKVIIETCLLTEDEKIVACLLAKKAGADFVKTSTGFSTGGATVADIRLMRKVVGPKMGVKASGGVRTEADARAMVAAGANRIGASSGIKIVDLQLDILESLDSK
ncbi:MAG: deoxyribose-phosphate aldolase [Candidatus Cloacimonetes bacterium]|nr:deoxyribose-phosphate aldolase [Candidatus Cloacimonadota bacterium]